MIAGLVAPDDIQPARPGVLPARNISIAGRSARQTRARPKVKAEQAAAADGVNPP